MALSGTNRGSGNHNTSAGSFTLSPTSNCTANKMIVLCVAADNSSSGGSSNDFTTVTDSIGNTWTFRQTPIFDNGAPSAGVQGLIATTNQNVGAITTGTTITVSFGSSPTAKTWTLTEISGSVGNVGYVTGNVGTGAFNPVPSITSSSITSGNAIIAAVFMESGTAQSIATDDTDSSNGNWGNSGASQYNEVGATTSGSAIASNFKITTGTGTQTYNLTLNGACDHIAAWIEVREITATLKDIINGFGVIPYLR